MDPVWGWQSPCGTPTAFHLDKKEKSGHKTLKEVKDVIDWLYDMAESRPKSAVEYDLPLNATFWGEE